MARFGEQVNLVKAVGERDSTGHSAFIVFDLEGGYWS